MWWEGVRILMWWEGVRILMWWEGVRISYFVSVLKQKKTKKKIIKNSWNTCHRGCIFVSLPYICTICTIYICTICTIYICTIYKSVYGEAICIATKNLLYLFSIISVIMEIPEGSNMDRSRDVGDAGRCSKQSSKRERFAGSKPTQKMRKFPKKELLSQLKNSQKKEDI